VQQADALQQQGTADAYGGALRLLREAQAIIPQYPNAVRLYGIVSEKMGNLPPSALSDADTKAYNQAYSLFLSGAYQDAYDEVMTIWPSNRNYGPLLRLKKRLEVQLNIS
jgi:TolA-binding protein